MSLVVQLSTVLSGTPQEEQRLFGTVEDARLGGLPLAASVATKTSAAYASSVRMQQLMGQVSP